MQRDIAITSDIAGTTRDVIEGHLDIGGYPLILQDTAGINEETQDIIEKEGIKKAKSTMQNADIKIIIYDATKEVHQDDFFADLIDDNTIIVLNKIDKISNITINKIHNKTPLKTSIKTQNGLKELFEEIINISNIIARPSETPQITRSRHRASLEQALEYLNNFSLDNDLVLTSEDIRMTMRSISHITGKITVDEILGEIFSNFCIGK